MVGVEVLVGKVDVEDTGSTYSNWGLSCGEEGNCSIVEYLETYFLVYTRSYF